MKAYKIAVPESCHCTLTYGMGKKPKIGGRAIYYEFTRHEIHELIKAHAEKLQYEICDDGYTYNINEPYIIFYEDATVFTEHNVTVFNDCKFQEISWRDFLKLTPEDVKMKERKVVELGAEMQEKIGVSEHTEKYFNSLPTNSDHNKKALLEAFTAGWDAAHNNRFSIGVNFDKWYHEKEGQ